MVKKRKKNRSAWLLLKKGNKVLIVKRSDKVNNSGQWGFPGGGHKKMKYVELILKETKEEIGIKVKPVAIFKKQVGNHIHKYFVATYKPDIHKIVLNYESSEFKFIHLSELSNVRNPHRSIKFLML